MFSLKRKTAEIRTLHFDGQWLNCSLLYWCAYILLMKPYLAFGTERHGVNVLNNVKISVIAFLTVSLHWGYKRTFFDGHV